jgi:hypothetical protein
MPRPTLEYKIRIQLPAEYGAALQRLAAREHKKITALIREFVGEGLRASGIDMSTKPIAGQTAIDDPEGDE